jgi:hypothetical protein
VDVSSRARPVTIYGSICCERTVPMSDSYLFDLASRLAESRVDYLSVPADLVAVVQDATRLNAEASLLIAQLVLRAYDHTAHG